MTVNHYNFTLDSTTPQSFTVADSDNRRGTTVISKNPHSSVKHVLIGGSTISTTSFGHELQPGETLTVQGWLSARDTFYFMAEAGSQGVPFKILEVA